MFGNGNRGPQGLGGMLAMLMMAEALKEVHRPDGGVREAKRNDEEFDADWEALRTRLKEGAEGIEAADPKMSRIVRIDQAVTLRELEGLKQLHTLVEFAPTLIREFGHTIDTLGDAQILLTHDQESDEMISIFGPKGYLPYKKN